MADAADDVVELGMGERLAAGDGDDAGSQATQMVDALDHLSERHRLGDLVIFVAIAAGEVAESRRHDLRHYGVAGKGERAAHHQHFSYLPRRRFPAPAQGRSPGSCHPFH